MILGIQLVSLLMYMIFKYQNLKLSANVACFKNRFIPWLPRTSTILDMASL